MALGDPTSGPYRPGTSPPTQLRVLPPVPPSTKPTFIFNPTATDPAGTDYDVAPPNKWVDTPCYA